MYSISEYDIIRRLFVELFYITLYFLVEMNFYGYGSIISAYIIFQIFSRSELNFVTFGSLIALFYQLYCFYSNLDFVYNIMFLVILLFDLLIWEGFDDQDEDDKVNFRPYEEELRSFMFKTKPSKLHRVDGWLDKYYGREREFIDKLKTKYSNSDNNIKFNKLNDDDKIWEKKLRLYIAQNKRELLTSLSSLVIEPPYYGSYKKLYNYIVVDNNN